MKEGSLSQFKVPFDHKSQLVTRFKPLEPTAEPVMIEPQGQAPFLIYCDNTLDEDSSSKEKDQQSP